MIQLATTLLTNPHVTNFFSGRLYRGELKNFCAPGLNCWSCPAATVSCPIGALQAVGGAGGKFSFYAAGCTLLIGLILGRAVCGFLCPFGLIQELLNKIPSPKISLPKKFSRVKYFLLIIFVLILPVATKFGEPTFCEYICPAGTLEAGLPLLATHEEFRSVLGNLFALKISILLAVIFLCVFAHRFFCRVMCPLGAIYGLMNKFSFFQLNYAAEKCVGCGRCKKICPLELDPTKDFSSAECVRCGRCEKICPTRALTQSITAPPKTSSPS
ncbi:MAG: 4Fe-4S binding protein [Selenomonadaceae bacterium]|nr:4Fe-4S binding protein [Selenomonadaceae bacterium]MBQ9497523.1 4Fe-4S binding protein [Selenomonadaceae bacterium]